MRPVETILQVQSVERGLLIRMSLVRVQSEEPVSKADVQ